MIKTKSILTPKSESDGTRICVMRFVKKSSGYDFDEWLKGLAPSINLLNEYRQGKIDWDEYEIKYTREMEDNKELISRLRIRSNNGEVITLLCWEVGDSHCHRRLLKDLIEK